MTDLSARIVDGKLEGISIERFCVALEWRSYLLRRWIAEQKRKHYIAGIERILREPIPNRALDSEDIFARLQDEYCPPDPYGYDSYHTWCRASERVKTILAIPELQIPGIHVLELASGDGMTGKLLYDYGHNVTLCDVEDWRDDHARSLPFLECDICQTIPLEDESFDLIYSYNAFEHLSDPDFTFHEIKRLSRSGGVVILSFGPLYSSPWGLHAYRALNMPYPQFLFSKSFILRKIRQLRIFDLGRETDLLQPLNEWRFEQYQALWHDNCFEIVEEHLGEDWSHLGLVMRFPEQFSGKNLRVVDLVTTSIHVVLKKISRKT